MQSVVVCILSVNLLFLDWFLYSGLLADWSVQNQQFSPLYFLLRDNLNKKQNEGDDADEDEQVAEDEELAANVEGVPQAQPQLLHLGKWQMA